MTTQALVQYEPIPSSPTALAREMDWYEKMELSRRSADPDLLDELAREDSCWYVRTMVAGHTDSLPETLEWLEGHSVRADDWFLLKVLGGNRNCPVQVLIRLSRHGNEEVRDAVYENPSTPPILRARMQEFGARYGM